MNEELRNEIATWLEDHEYLSFEDMAQALLKSTWYMRSAMTREAFGCGGGAAGGHEPTWCNTHQKPWGHT